VESRKKYVIMLAVLVPITLILHFYSQILVTPTGQSTIWRHVLSDLCYLPIVLAAIWFGLRGAVITTTVIAGFSLLFLVLYSPFNPHEVLGDYIEIIFFYLVGAVSGIVLDRDRRLRRMLAETQKNLYQAERLSIIGQMVASIVHEFKNPLISIIGATRILREKALTDDQRSEYVGVIENEAKRLDGSVRILLTYPRPTPSNLSEIDIRETLAALQRQLGFQCSTQGVRMVLKSGEIPPIWGDRDKLYQAFSNIIINAIQAMPDGGKLDLSCAYVNLNARGSVVIEIIDTGPGIANELLPKIFQPFFTTKSDGTGLGLAIARSIIKEHGGGIEIDSAEGKGTRFIITLPATANDKA
jgi:two-component system, NtrC family, sensor histidine kinase HydH